MPYNKGELLALLPEEKMSLAEELWGSVKNELLPITEDEVAFANPTQGVSPEQFESYFSNKYGF